MRPRAGSCAEHMHSARNARLTLHPSLGTHSLPWHTYCAQVPVPWPMKDSNSYDVFAPHVTVSWVSGFF